ncbi:hypothetical protein BaRGS_00001986 [Batillaria attramentaria]|uniref:Uncharacterized protein n=1 Tax=Batillaria attramentaria TaxID=370345 RepID=A0ABD0M4P6_9CAEN
MLSRAHTVVPDKLLMYVCIPVLLKDIDCRIICSSCSSLRADGAGYKIWTSGGVQSLNNDSNKKGDKQDAKRIEYQKVIQTTDYCNR